MQPLSSARRRDYLARRRRSVSFVLPPGAESRDRARRRQPCLDVAGREYIDYHMSSGPALLGHAHPAITAAVVGAAAEGHDVLLPERARDRARASGWSRRFPAPTSSTTRAPAPRRRSTALRIARAFTRPQQDPEIRGRLARHARLRAVGHRADRRVGVPAREARLGRRAAAGRRDGAGRAVQRNGAQAVGDDRAPRARRSRR